MGCIRRINDNGSIMIHDVKDKEIESDLIEEGERNYLASKIESARNRIAVVDADTGIE